MIIKVVSILGGPRLTGSSATLLESMEHQLKEEGFEIIRINAAKLELKPCYSCDRCHRDGSCIVKDDMDRVLSLFEEADIVISSSPIFFATVPAQFKLIIDRCQSLWAEKYIVKDRTRAEAKKRLGYFIATGGAPEHTIPFNCLKEVIDLFYKAINVKYWGNTFIGDLDRIALADRQDILHRVKNDCKGLIEEYYRIIQH